MHRKKRLSESVMQLTASNGDETWIYRFPDDMWVSAASKIMHDARDKKIPVPAARGLLDLMVEARHAD